MKTSRWLPCPVCGLAENEVILSLDCGIINGSPLYPTVNLVSCHICGHCYNDLSPAEVEGLGRYYNEEYAPTNLNSVLKDGDLPGSTGAFTYTRYSQLYEMLTPHIGTSAAILDVGCAVGGFLHFLEEQGFSHLYGVDVTEAYAARARENANFTIELGNAESLPFPDHIFDCLVIEQVLEHLVNPAVGFREAARVLKKGGVLCVGVPDAARYGDFYFFDYYWLLLREHIQHFDIEMLHKLAGREGFRLLRYQQNSHIVMGEAMVMPNLCAVFQYTGVAQEPASVGGALRKVLSRHVVEEQARQVRRQDIFASLAQGGAPIYVWGIGREFLYLYESCGLKQCNLAGLIDVNPFKHATMAVGGKRVASPELLTQAGSDSILIPTAIAHCASIEKAARSCKFAGTILEL